MCTNFSLISQEADMPYCISARTMDFAPDLSTVLAISPRGMPFPLLAPTQNALKGNNKFGFVGMNSTLDGSVAFADGLNERGLSAGSLWLAGSKYASSAASTKPTIFNSMLIGWILGNFETVDEVKEAMLKVNVASVSEVMPSADVTLHYIVHDRNGRNLIIEFTNGYPEMYECANGVMANTPSYPWHVDNMSMVYSNLGLANGSGTFAGQAISGTGLLGMPGDYTSPSRFVRMWMLQQSAQNYTPKTNAEAVGMAARILQNVAQPLGSNISAGANPVLEYTHWGVVRDQKELAYYFFTQLNNNLFGVDLKKIDFATVAAKTMQVIRPDWESDITASLLRG